ncbi:MAG: hypothetical protein Q8P24_01745 [Desulfobacterales bacterium]|nr:hypothetical protein [Desulfobacterales bacterium]
MMLLHRRDPGGNENFLAVSGGVGQIWSVIFLVFILSVSACKPITIVPDTTWKPSGAHKILVLPFVDMAAIYGENVSVRCMVCGAILTTGKVEKDAVNLLSDHLTSVLLLRKDFIPIPSSQAQGLLPSFSSGKGGQLSELEELVATGRALDADSVLVGHIFRYQERAGTRYAVDTPASVAFDVDIIGIKENRVVWSGLFNETQQSLFENLFNLGSFLKRKGTFITAKEMAFSGLEELFQKLPAK